MTKAPPLPISEFIPREYLIHIHRTKCKNCLHEMETCTIYLVRCFGQYRRLIPVSDGAINPSLPIGASKLQLKLLPFCHKCYTGIGGATLPPVSEQRWQEAVKRTQESIRKAEQRSRFPSTKRIASQPSIDDLPDI